MIWFVFAIFTAFFESMKDVFSKKGLRNIDEYLVSWSLTSFALPFLIPLLFFIEIPPLKDRFWTALSIGGGLNVVATVLYMKAIRHSDLSITVPMVTFTPLFLLITSPLTVGEFPSLLGSIGIFLIFVGSYVLNLNEKEKGYLAPFRGALKDKGPRLMLAVAFIWSITSNYDKIGVQNSSPLFWAVAINIFIFLLMLPIMLVKSKGNLKAIPKNLGFLIPIGLCGALTVIFQMLAINLTLVAYVISIKRASAVMSVVFGYLIFKERDIKKRLAGAAIMIMGVVFITLL